MSFLVWVYKSQDFAQTQHNFARSHDRVTVTFRNSGHSVKKKHTQVHLLKAWDNFKVASYKHCRHQCFFIVLLASVGFFWLLLIFFISISHLEIMCVCLKLFILIIKKSWAFFAYIIFKYLLEFLFHRFVSSLSLLRLVLHDFFLL